MTFLQVVFDHLRISSAPVSKDSRFPVVPTELGSVRESMYVDVLLRSAVDTSVS